MLIQKTRIDNLVKNIKTFFTKNNKKIKLIVTSRIIFRYLINQQI